MDEMTGLTDLRLDNNPLITPPEEVCIGGILQPIGLFLRNSASRQGTYRISTYTCTYTHTDVYTSISMHIYVYTRILAYRCIHACTCTYTQTHAYTSVSMHIRVYMHTHAHTHAYPCVCTYTHIHARTRICMRAALCSLQDWLYLKNINVQ